MSKTFARCTFALLMAIVLLMGINTASAQSSTSGSISGTITDSSGAAVPGAVVKLTNTDRGAVQATLTTNSAGFYTAGTLPLGNYSVTITKSGFKTETVKGITLHVADALTVNQKLTPGGMSDVVTVTADTVQINLQDATSAGLINSTQIDNLPLLTSNYETLLNLQPGVAFGGQLDDIFRGPVNPDGGSNQVNFSINGGRNTSNGWTLDGADNVDRGANLTLYVYPSPDSIAEFKTLRGQYSAQFGRNASGQIDVVTKSGTNDLHGDAYEHLRNRDFNANNPSANATGGTRPPYDYNLFGFTVGGPVYIPKLYNGRNKTFFFASEEWERIVLTIPAVTVKVPQASERAGDFSQSGIEQGTTWTTGPVGVCTSATNTPTSSTCNSVAYGPTNLAASSPMGAAYVKDIFSKIPVPDVAANLAANRDPHTIFANFKNSYQNNDTVVRIDQQIGQKLSAFYRYMHDTYPEILAQGGPFTTNNIPGAGIASVQNPGTQHLGKATWLISPTLVLNAGYAFSYGGIISTSQGFMASNIATDVKPTLPYPDSAGLVPELSYSSAQTNVQGSIAYTDHGTNHQIFGDITKTLHNHTIIAGISYNHYQKLESGGSATNGVFGFSSDILYPGLTVTPSTSTTPGSNLGCPGDALCSGYDEAQNIANILIGNANGGFSQVSANLTADIKDSLYEAYAQDNWKATPRLTLNFGVRYGFYGQPWDGNGHLSSFDPDTYDASKAPTISSNGQLCLTQRGATSCNQAGSNAGQPTTPNANADYVGVNYINGMIFGSPSAANNNQASPYGKHVGMSQKLNFAPRLGFAYDLLGDGKTSVRGGYGISFDDTEVSYYETSLFNNPPAVATYSATYASFDNPTGGGLGSTFSLSPGYIRAVPLKLNTPYVQQFSLDVQHQFTPTFFVDAGYYGNTGVHLMGSININQPKAGAWVGVVNPETANAGCWLNSAATPTFLTSACDAVLNQIVPYKGYSYVSQMQSIFNSNYNSLQVTATKRFWGITYLTGNFTWSKSLGDGQNDYSTSPQDIYNIAGEYGRSAVDRKFLFNLNGVIEEPWFRDQRGVIGHVLGGWRAAGIFMANSGLPLTVQSSLSYTLPYNLPNGMTSVYNNQTNGGVLVDNAGINANNGAVTPGTRPNLIGNPNKSEPGVKIHNKGFESQPWFYTGAFAAAPATSSRPGNERRGVINGPGYSRYDFSVMRIFRLWENVDFSFRAEAMNAFNHTNPYGIDTSPSAGSLYGTVISYRDPRIVQFTGKFTF